MRSITYPHMLIVLGMSLLKRRGAHSIAASNSLHSRRVYVSEFRHGVTSAFTLTDASDKSSAGSSSASSSESSTSSTFSTFSTSSTTNFIPPSASSSFACNVEVGRHKTFSDLKALEDGCE